MTVRTTDREVAAARPASTHVTLCESYPGHISMRRPLFEVSSSRGAEGNGADPEYHRDGNLPDRGRTVQLLDLVRLWDSASGRLRPSTPSHVCALGQKDGQKTPRVEFRQLKPVMVQSGCPGRRRCRCPSSTSTFGCVPVALLVSYASDSVSQEVRDASSGVAVLDERSTSCGGLLHLLATPIYPP
jgi:hypothetical protein